MSTFEATRERGKYGNKPLLCSSGVWHASKLEARRCTDLHLLQQAGAISNLKAHPQQRFNLDVNGVHICMYMADFVYVRTDTGETMVEDTKGHATEVYKLKRRLMLACHGIEIQEVRK